MNTNLFWTFAFSACMTAPFPSISPGVGIAPLRVRGSRDTVPQIALARNAPGFDFSLTLLQLISF
jgi:hypothetical protein